MQNKKMKTYFFKFISSSVYQKTLRLRGVFFLGVSALFLVALSLGFSLQTSFYVLTRQEQLSLSETLICLFIIPVFFLICASVCDDMFDLVFDSMDNPPFIKARAHLATAFSKQQNQLFRINKINNLIIIFGLEFFPLFISVLYIFQIGSFTLSNFLTGYLFGGFFFSLGISIYYIICHLINSYSESSQDNFYDYWRALETLETSKGFFSSFRIKLENFKTEEHDKAVKKPKGKLGLMCFILALSLIVSSSFLAAVNLEKIFTSVLMIGLSLVFFSLFLKFYFPKFLGMSFNFLVFIYIIASISLTYFTFNKSNLFGVRASAVLKVEENNINLPLNEISKFQSKYPICKMRWSNNYVQDNLGHLSALDLIHLSSIIYNYREDLESDFEQINEAYQELFKSTNAGPIIIEELEPKEQFGRSVIIYFPKYKIRVMAIRGTLVTSELLYDLNIFSFIQTLNIFDVITPVIGLLPERIVQQITKYVDIKRMFGKEDMIEKVYQIARKQYEKSREFGDEFIIIGHSLGGAMTAIISSRLNVSGVAFSPPGTKSVLKRFGIENQSQTLKSLTTVMMDKDIVSMVDEHIGSVNKLNCPYQETSLCHDPHAILCELYSSCGDHRQRSLTYGCSEEEMKSVVKEYRR